MSAETQVLAILQRWEELARQGQNVPPAELCRDHPELLSEVERRLEALQRVASPAATTDERTTTSPGPATAGQDSSTPRSFSQMPLPRRFGRYLLLQRLGEGGMGTVYLAHDSVLDCQVAIKVAKGQEEEDPLVVERFRREAQAAANLRHEGLCRVMDFGQHEGVYYITMEYIAGRSLAQHLKQTKNQPVDQRWAARLMAQTAVALDVAHRQGVVHRDLKPGNILLNADDRPCVVDFGLARRLQDTTLTRPGATPGTPAFMSPEQVQGKPITPQTDIYSLGIIFYQMLTRRLPFLGEEIYQTFFQILYETPQPPSAHRPDLDPALEAICLKAFARAEADRFRTMGEFAAQLQAYLEGTAQPGVPEQEIGSRDLFRIARPVPPAENSGPMLLDVGFLRARLKSVGGPTEPLFCGCSSARLILRLDGGRSVEDPSFPTLPPSAQARVEYGIGPRPSVRFEAPEPGRMLEGRARIAYAVEQTKPNALRVAVTLEPEWFTVAGPASTTLDSAAKIVVSALLRRLSGAVSRRFNLGESDARPQ
jgi:serine/threonine protein kinase